MAIKDSMHSDFSTGSGVWVGYRHDLTGDYVSRDGTGGNYHEFADGTFREYNKKLNDIGVVNGEQMYIEPYDGGLRYIGDPFIYNNGGCVGAYSVRTIGFGGSLMRIRRNSDNAELDVRGDANGDISLASPLVPSSSGNLGDFVGSASGYCTTWYDQSATGAAQNNMSNATASEQPMLISAGSLLTENGRPTLSGFGSHVLFGGGIQGTDGGGRPTGKATTLTDDFAFSIVGVFERSNADAMLIGDTWDTSGPAIDGSYMWLSSPTNMRITTYKENGGQNWTIDNPIGEQKLWFVRRKSTTVGLSDNGVEDAKTELSTQGNKFSVSRLFGGYGQGYDLSGSLQEVILYNTDQTDNRTAIQTNINNYYNIY
tara:strand:- start:66 stop:1175 length:1110 start_codon:yes stop_codon:yes gene_type:complete